MSPDLERRLRDAGSGLGAPDGEATKRAREAALTAVAGRLRRRGPRGLAFGVVALVAIAIGIAIGSLTLAGRGEASKTQGLGFLPADGWVVLQSGTPTTPDRPGIALAANVPLHPQDTADGFPYSTLQALPEHGVVLVASFMRVGDGHEGSAQLPLSLQDAVPYIRYGGQVRPRLPLGQYELRAMVEGYAVEVHAYFGMRDPSSALLAEAQRQLDRLVVSPEGEAPAGAPPRAPARGNAVTIAFQRYWDAACRCYKLRFFGQVSSGAADEYVSVMHKPCRASFSTAIAGATTVAGGGWEVEPSFPPGAGEFRARWNDELSEPVSYRPPLVPNVVRRRPGAYRVEVYSYVPSGGKPVILTGRQVEVQRLQAGQWSRIRRGKLIGFGSNLYNRTYFANFTVPRGLTLRASVSAKTALPCWSAGVSKTFRS
jgi:hypothetical protein